MGKRWCQAPAVALLVTAGVTGCGASGAATEFCTSYGDTMRPLVEAARNHGPEEFGRALDTALSILEEMRGNAPDERLGDAFATASFTFTVFSSEDRLADFLSRADFSDNAMVLACADYGVEIAEVLASAQ